MAPAPLQLSDRRLAVATMLIVFAVLLFASINWLRGRTAAASKALV